MPRSMVDTIPTNLKKYEVVTATSFQLRHKRSICLYNFLSIYVKIVICMSFNSAIIIILNSSL